MGRKTAEDYHKLAESRGFKWLGPKVGSTQMKTWWECEYGHRWETTYAPISYGGTGCPYCAGKAPKTARDYHEAGKDRAIEWIGEELPRNIKAKTPWKCSRGHKWETCYNNIRRGTGCPHCAKITIEDYHAIGNSRSIKWIGKELPNNTDMRTLWQCSAGHEWETSYHTIRQGCGCPYCVGKAIKTVKDYREVGKDRNIEWAGKELPKNVLSKTLWRCSVGHVWEAHYNSIQQERGCPHCLDMVNGVQVSQPQKLICEMLGGMLNYPCDPYHIDIVLLDKMIAIEYDCYYWHGHRQNYDAERDAFLLAKGWKILHIKSSDDVPLKWELEEAIAKLENGEKRVEIVLDDWGRRKTFAEAQI